MNMNMNMIEDRAGPVGMSVATADGARRDDGRAGTTAGLDARSTISATEVHDRCPTGMKTGAAARDLHNRAGRSGFTLIEVSIAMTVAAIAILGLLSVMVAATGVARKASDETLQGMIVQELISEVKACPFDDVVLKNSLGSNVNASVNLGALTANHVYGELFFDPDGIRVQAGPQYFKCIVEFSPVTSFTNDVGVFPSGRVARALFKFVEPAHSINPVVTNIFYTRIYEHE